MDAPKLSWHLYDAKQGGLLDINDANVTGGYPSVLHFYYYDRYATYSYTPMWGSVPPIAVVNDWFHTGNRVDAKNVCVMLDEEKSSPLALQYFEDEPHNSFSVNLLEKIVNKEFYPPYNYEELGFYMETRGFFSWVNTELNFMLGYDKNGNNRKLILPDLKTGMGVVFELVFNNVENRFLPFVDNNKVFTGSVKAKLKIQYSYE